MKPFEEVAREYRQKVAEGIFEKKWSCSEVEENEISMFVEVLRKVRLDALDEAAEISLKYGEDTGNEYEPKDIAKAILFLKEREGK